MIIVAMIDRAALETLIARIEKAAEGSRDLDIEIGTMTGRGYHDEPCLGAYCWTRSLDAAVTLIPDVCDMIDFHQGPPMGFVWTLSEIDAGGVKERGRGYSEHSMILALCAAALRCLLT